MRGELPRKTSGLNQKEWVRLGERREGWPLNVNKDDWTRRRARRSKLALRRAYGLEFTGVLV